jgi:hypothetical protein
MTRADLINALGVGSKLSPSALSAARSLEKYTRKNDDDDDDNDDDNDEDGDSTSSEEGNSDDDDDEDIEEGGLLKIIPCTKQDIGGFYSAFCSLGTKVEIGTKVRNHRSIFSL